MGIIRGSRVEELEKNSEGLLQENCEIVNKNIDICNRIELLVNSNAKLTLFFTIPERSNEDEIIETMISETTMLERTLEATPNIYALRVFSDNPLVPERWPIFMNSSRTDLGSLARWEYGYTADYLGNLGALKYDSVCTTRRLENSFTYILIRSSWITSKTYTFQNEVFCIAIDVAYFSHKVMFINLLIKA